MNIEIYQERGKILPKQLWVYRDFSNPEVRSAQNIYYQIRFTRQETTCGIKERAACYDYIKKSIFHVQVDFDTLDPKIQEIILEDFPELDSEDEFSKYEVS